MPTSFFNGINEYRFTNGIILIYASCNSCPQHLTAFIKYLIILLNIFLDLCPFLLGRIPRQSTLTRLL